MRDIYNDRLGRGIGAGETLALVALGVAAGALATWLITSANKEKISLGSLGEVNPREWLSKAAQSLQRGRDRLINAVEERSSSR